MWKLLNKCWRAKCEPHTSGTWKLLSVDAGGLSASHKCQALGVCSYPEGFFLSNALAPKHLRGRSSAKHLIITIRRALKVCYNTSAWLPSPSSEPTWSHFKISRPWSKDGLRPYDIPPRPPTPEHQLTSVATTPTHLSTASPPPLLQGRESFKS